MSTVDQTDGQQAATAENRVAMRNAIVYSICQAFNQRPQCVD